MKMLDINSPDFGASFLEAIGAKRGDHIEIVTPQFERTDGVVPVLGVDSWEALRSTNSNVLESLGCGRWDAPDRDGRVLMLFPVGWYWLIPDGFHIEFIDGESGPFKRGDTDDDYRFGCLAFGVRVRGEGE